MDDATRAFITGSIADIRATLERLESFMIDPKETQKEDIEKPSIPPGFKKPSKIYQMFPSNDAEDELDDVAEAAMERSEEENEDQQDEEEFDVLDEESLDAIDEDIEDESEDSETETAILQCLTKASHVFGMSTEDVCKNTNLSKSCVVKTLKSLFLNNRIERVCLRPLTYRSILEEDQATS